MAKNSKNFIGGFCTTACSYKAAMAQWVKVMYFHPGKKGPAATKPYIAKKGNYFIPSTFTILHLTILSSSGPIFKESQEYLKLFLRSS